MNTSFFKNLGITEEQMRNQYKKNVDGLKFMLSKAEQSKNGKYNGFTVDQLKERIAVFEKLSTDFKYED